MRCPACVEEGARSTVRPEPGALTTAVASYPWFDEDGNWHDHDPNWRTRGWVCSRGHEGYESWLPECPQGDYGEGPNVVLSGETR